MVMQHSAPTRFALGRWLALAITAWLWITLSANVTRAQGEKPIDKEGVLKAIDVIASRREPGRREYATKYLIQLVQRLGVDFELTKDAEYELSLQAALQKTGIDLELMRAVRKNYRADLEAVNAYNQALKHYGGGNFEGAINDYQRAILRDPKFAEAYYGRGLARHRLGRYKEAKEDFEKAKDLRSDYADAYYGLGLMLYQIATVSGQPEKAIEDQAIEAFKKAVEINQACAEAHFMLGQIYYNRGNYQAAIATLDQAATIQATLEQERRDARNQEIQKAVNEAIQRSGGEVAEAPSEINRARYLLGKSYFASGKKNEAREAYAKAIELNPDDAESHYELGVVYYNLDRNPEAIESFKKALASFKKASESSPSQVANAHYRLGICYFESGLKKEALDEGKLLEPLDKALADRLAKYINR
jgi:tetratricopeptide (TPR) repeat protein